QTVAGKQRDVERIGLDRAVALEPAVAGGGGDMRRHFVGPLGRGLDQVRIPCGIIRRLRGGSSREEQETGGKQGSRRQTHWWPDSCTTGHDRHPSKSDRLAWPAYQSDGQEARGGRHRFADLSA